MLSLTPVERIRPRAHRGRQPHHRLVVFDGHTQADDLVIEAIQLLPHLGADLFAHLRGVLARRGKARDHRRPVADVGRQASNGFLRIRVAGLDLQADRVERAEPALVGRHLDAAEHQRVRRVDDTRDVVRPLEVAAHPVETVGDSGKHASVIRVASQAITRHRFPSELQLRLTLL